MRELESDEEEERIQRRKLCNTQVRGERGRSERKQSSAKGRKQEDEGGKSKKVEDREEEEGSTSWDSWK